MDPGSREDLVACETHLAVTDWPFLGCGSGELGPLFGVAAVHCAPAESLPGAGGRM